MWVVVYSTGDDLESVFGAFRTLGDAKAFVKEDVKHTQDYLKGLLDKNVGHFKVLESFNSGSKLMYHITNVGDRTNAWEIRKLQKERKA